MKRLAHLAVVLAAAGALLTACHRPSDLPDGSVSRTKVDFQAPAAGGNPTAETLLVSNGGRGTLEAPSVAVSYQDGADWLTVTVTSSGDQYAIAVQPITTGLAAGTYRATLTLTWASGSSAPTLVAVTLVVPARTVDPGYQPSVEAVAIDAPRGGGDPAPAAFQVVNAGRGTLPVPSIDVAYAGTVAGWLTTAVAAASGGYTVTAQAHVAGIPSGVHRATLTLRAAGGVVPARTLPATLTVPPPEVALSSREVALRAPAGGLDVTASLTVANAGGGQLATPVAIVSYESGSAASWDGLLDVAVSGSPAQYKLTFTAHQVRSTAGGSSKLPPGTYTAVVQASAPGAAVSDTARVTFEVPAPTMQLSSSQVAFSGYTSCPLLAPATVSVTNGGGGTLAPPVVAQEPGVDAWLAASVAASGSEAYAVVLTPRAYPPVEAGGAVETTVMITDPTGVASALPLRVRFDVLAPELATATVRPSPLKIWAQDGMGDPAPRTISLRTPGGCFPAPAVTIDATDGVDPATWVSIGAIASSPRQHDVSVHTRIAGLAAGERRAATVHVRLGGSTWDVPVTVEIGTLAAAGKMTGGGTRSGAALTPLADGRVLRTGGGAYDSLFDPSTRTWTALPSSWDLYGQGTVQLDDGRVLMCGGTSYVGTPDLTCRALSGSTWSTVGTLTRPRQNATLLTMPGGRVLVLGGMTYSGSPPPFLHAPEIFDLATGRSTLLTSIGADNAVKRANGSILALEGAGATAKAWLYAPERDAWARTGARRSSESSCSLLPLPDGRVLALWNENEIWDPATGAWSSGSASQTGGKTATLLSSGKILVTGACKGSLCGSPELEVYDPATDTWSRAGAFASTQRRSVAVTTLASGMVLFAGGYEDTPTGMVPFMSPETFTW